MGVSMAYVRSFAGIVFQVGSAAAYLQTGMFSARRYFVLLISSVLIITWLNLSNDVYDFDTGADKNKTESVVNLVGSRTGTLVAAYLLLVLGFVGLTWASVEAGNLRAIMLLTCAVICGYIYQSLLSNVKQNDTFFIAQVEGDRNVGKMSPLVRLGTERGSVVVKWAVMTLYSLLFAIGLSRALPLSCIFLCAMTSPIGKLVVSYVEENHKDKGKIFMAKYYCVRLHALFGAALVAGLITARILVTKHIPKLVFQ
ncbi:2-carboxy-1,4-naphthoquinone phytyltransferase [Citrus sinensis]|uniref:2-carboxy-1,4-naphthoquinone phytyltransferase n=1 Tax=Citrus sinensis TaxID=2711 RepID=A0ACB8IKK9_CITSI|nr:2-carboxy-1,4-naphthoquinone phytyltransferase [Citrus sinensis]